ncbi:MAG: hypothetical protein R3280_13975, partial [Marinobacter sp.]|nr:hypothetical protein [Marinobacter sp.]
MSLLNDALRSAEQRRERPAPTAYTGVSAPTSTPAAGRRPQLWLVLLVVVLAVVVWLWWSQTRPDPVTSQPVAEGVVAREPAPATRSPAEPVVTKPGDFESTTAEAEPELVAPPEPETVIAETRAESAETDAAVSGESVEPSSVEP